MINSVELVNWRTHKHTTLGFQRGVNVLIGIMGAGKSSVLDGLSFGLFGTFPALVHRRTTLDGLILNKPTQESEATVRIGFDVGGDHYTVTRRITKGEGTSSRLDKNGAYLQTQTERVNEEIALLLKVDYDTFSRVIYSEQNRLDYFLDLAKGDRKKQIDQMLGLDRFAKAEENATSLINSIKSMVKDEEQMLSQMDISGYKKQLESLSIEREKLEKEREALAKEVEKTKEVKEREKALNSQLKELREGKDRTTRALADAESELRSNANKMKERDKIIAELKGKEVSALAKELKYKGESLQELMKNVAALKGKKKELTEWVGELSKHISKCPICERALDDELKARLLGEKSELARKVDKDIELGAGQIDELSKKIEQTTKEHNSLLLSSKRLDDYKDIDALAKKAKEDIEKAKKKLDASAKDVENTEKELDRLRDALKEHAVNVSKLDESKRLLANINAQIDEKAKQISNVNVMRDRIEKRRRHVGELNKFKSALVDTEALLRNKLIASINNLMQSVWSEIYPYADYNAIRLDAGKDDYMLEANAAIGNDGARQWMEVDGMASGGEKSMACLAMRIAFAMVVVPNLKWLILDEPTHNIDEAGIGKFIEVLGNSLPKVVEQVFIITHDSELRQIASARIYQLERDKNRNEYTKVVEL